MDYIPFELISMVSTYMIKPAYKIVDWLPLNRNDWIRRLPQHFHDIIYDNLMNNQLEINNTFHSFTSFHKEIRKVLYDEKTYLCYKIYIEKIPKETIKDELIISYIICSYPDIDNNIHIQYPHLGVIDIETTYEKRMRKAHNIDIF